MTLKFENRSSEQIQTKVTFELDVRLSHLIIQDARNWIYKLSQNSNDNNFLLESSIESCCISRRTKLKTVTLSKFKRQYLFTRMSNWVPSYIETHKIENRNTEQFQTIITFYSDVWLIPKIYRDAQTWKQTLWANSNDNNFWLGCPIELFNNLWQSKLNTEALTKFKWQ